MFHRSILDAARAHALDAFPHEACGVVAGGAYHRCRNIAADPRTAFDVAPEDLVTIEGQVGRIEALIHSHPNGPAGPSKADIEGQMAWGIPWGIVVTDGRAVADSFFWGEGIATPPYVGRDFRHGPSGSDGKGDCYALIRDWYSGELAIVLPEGPRDAHWWNAGENLYLDNFARAGLGIVALGRSGDFVPAYGDIFLAAVRSPGGVPNHGGIHIGGGRLLHHLEGRLSRIEPLNPWRRYITHWLRRTDAAIEVTHAA